MDPITVLSNLISAWERFCYNYRSTQRTWHDVKITVPEFIFKIDWPNGDADLMCEHWLDDCERYRLQGSPALHMFFLGLDQENKAALLRFANIIEF